jgi:hypothetical protein
MVVLLRRCCCHDPRLGHDDDDDDDDELLGPFHAGIDIRRGAGHTDSVEMLAMGAARQTTMGSILVAMAVAAGAEVTTCRKHDNQQPQPHGINYAATTRRHGDNNTHTRDDEHPTSNHRDDKQQHDHHSTHQPSTYHNLVPIYNNLPVVPIVPPKANRLTHTTINRPPALTGRHKTTKQTA